MVHVSILSFCYSILLIQNHLGRVAGFEHGSFVHRRDLVSSPPTVSHRRTSYNAENDGRIIAPTVLCGSNTVVGESDNSNIVDAEKTATARNLLSTLEELIGRAPKNGIDTPSQLESQIQSICKQLEVITPNPSPTRNPNLLNGFWYVLWTNYGPPAPSSGKLGPFVGDVYQDLQLPTTTTNNDGSKAGEARNIFRLDFPPIMGELFATPHVLDDTIVAITFCTVGTKFAGIFPLGPNVEFEKDKEVRLWDHAYVDTNYRILYARNAADTEGDTGRGFLYVMKRADESRFATNI